MHQRIQHCFTDGIHGILRNINPFSGDWVDLCGGACIVSNKCQGAVQHFWNRSFNSFAVFESISVCIRDAHFCSGDKGCNDAELRKKSLRIDAKQEQCSQGDTVVVRKACKCVLLIFGQ